MGRVSQSTYCMRLPAPRGKWLRRSALKLNTTNPVPCPRPRKRFQIHLSTAIVLMFVALILMQLNTYGRDGTGWIDLKFGVGSSIGSHKYYGWPLPAYF